MLVLEYDGTRYAGFQWQLGVPTVQAEIEKAIACLTGEKVRVAAAGRTDAGVHARGQVVTFTTAWSGSVGMMQRALNALLPPDIAVTAAQDVLPEFHARFSAVSRAYRYTIFNGPVRSPLLRTTCHHVVAALDVEAMHRAAQVLVGTHDFSAFGGPMREEGTTTRTVHSLSCQRDGQFVYVDIEANAYLSRMVRTIVGALIEVGRGKLTVDDLAALLRSGERRRGRKTAPAHGLCLMHVRYNEESV